MMCIVCKSGNKQLVQIVQVGLYAVQIVKVWETFFRVVFYGRFTAFFYLPTFAQRESEPVFLRSRVQSLSDEKVFAWDS